MIIFYYCTTNYRKFSSLKYHSFITHSSVDKKIQAGSPDSSTQGNTRPKFKCQSGLDFIWNSQETSHFPNSFQVYYKFYLLFNWWKIALQFCVGFCHQFSSVQFSCSVVSNPLRPHESQHTRPPCPSPTPGVYSNLCPSSQ